MNVITLDFSEQDAIRLLWLVQKEASTGHVYNDYWAQIALRIQQGVAEDGDQPEQEKPPV